MHPESPTIESDALDTLINPVDRERFQSTIRRLHNLFNRYAGTCPVPLPAPGLIVTPEIRTQCELYFPIAEVATAFNHLYSNALSYQPILSSTPFHCAMSWADTFAALPTRFQFSASPARLLESLLADRDLLVRFLFTSFLPDRFYGGIGRYPGQQKFVREWLSSRSTGTLHCLDAACGTGEESYGLALLLSEEGLLPAEIRIDGWTLEPLEVWAATHRRFPHDRRREELLRAATSALFQQGIGRRIRFRSRDILTQSPLENSDSRADFDLIICNGLLGGPIIHDRELLALSVNNLAQQLVPGGILLAANNFHGGWKQKCPQLELRALFEKNRLKVFDAGEGIGGLKPYQ
jgi:SAM-dependent methyltransferase